MHQVHHSRSRSRLAIVGASVVIAHLAPLALAQDRARAPGSGVHDAALYVDMAQQAANPRAPSSTIVVAQPHAPESSNAVVLTGFDDRGAWAEAAGCELAKVAFEDLADGTLITTELQPQGIDLVSGDSINEPGPTTQFVTSSASLPFPMFVAGTLPSEPNFISNRMTPGVFATGTLRVDFVAPTRALGAFVADQSPLDDFQIEVFDENGSLGVITVAPRTLPQSFVGVVSDVPFITARFIAVSPFDSWGLDDMEFCQQATPCFTLDFETEDDLVTPLVNGQHIDVEFGVLANLASSGANSGLGIFDSTPGGPNDPSQDRDLLVGTGNLLILQTENVPPNGSDVFPLPNDDEDGGTIIFNFTRAVEARSVRLVDLDAGDGPMTIVLTDSPLTRQRTFTVPSNWTGDLLLAQPGHGVLDLTSLAPQPGFGSVATANEDPGFDPLSVIQITFSENGSGGIDDLSFCPAAQGFQASAQLRNGSGMNPMSLQPLSLPVVGRNWIANLDCSAQGPGFAVLVVKRMPAVGTFSPHGELLVDGMLLHHSSRAHAGDISSLAWAIPLDLSLVGQQAHAQGFCIGQPTFVGLKIFHVRAELTNAVDLVLGF